MNREQYLILRIKALSEKNQSKEYSLGDCLLLGNWEAELMGGLGYTKDQIEKLSPSYYKSQSFQ